MFLHEPELPASVRSELQHDAGVLNFEVHELSSVAGSPARPVLSNHPRPHAARRLNALVRILQPPRIEALQRFWGSDLQLLRTHREALAARLAAALASLRALNPIAMVVSEDGISAPLAVHAAARQLNIPIVDVPYGYGVRRDLEIALDNRQQSSTLIRVRGICGTLIRLFAPQWIKRGRHEGALMLAPSYIVAAESLGITLRDAWMIHGGLADRLCVESKQMERLYVEEGVPKEKLASTGSPYCDVMVGALARNAGAMAALRQPRRIQHGRTRVLVSWPPSYHDERAQFSEFSTYRDMSVAILGWLARVPACDVTVSLHPATHPADRAALVEAGVPLTDEYVIESLGQCDLFVTYFSSTIRWAIAAGKPVVNYDLYKLGLNVYDAAPGVSTVADLASFKRIITELVESDAAFAAIAAKQIAVAEEWGTLDGHSTSRVAAEITK